LTTKQPRSESGRICCLGSASGDDLPLQKFPVCARTKKCNSHCVATTVTSVPWTKYQWMAASPWNIVGPTV